MPCQIREIVFVFECLRVRTLCRDNLGKRLDEFIPQCPCQMREIVFVFEFGRTATVCRVGENLGKLLDEFIPQCWRPTGGGEEDSFLADEKLIQHNMELRTDPAESVSQKLGGFERFIGICLDHDVDDAAQFQLDGKILAEDLFENSRPTLLKSD